MERCPDPEGQHATRVERIDDPVIPQPRGRVVGGSFALVRLQDRGLKGVAFGIGLGATVAVGLLQSWFRTLPIYGYLTWIAVAVGALVLLGAILFAATSRTRPR